MEKILHILKLFIPKKIFKYIQPKYHSSLATLAAIRYNFPSKKIYVVGITGTKGKSTVSELVSAILEEAGHTTALSSTIHFKIADEIKPNMYKMSMPGRFFMQSFLSKAVNEDCGFAIIEMTSEGAKLNRHKHIEMDALIFTNLSPEHIESHGSFENYRDAKLLLRDALVSSKKENKVIIVNKDDKHGESFLDVPENINKKTYSIKQAEPYTTNDRGSLLTYEGVSIHSPLPGKFNIYNILAAITFTRSLGIHIDVIKKAIEKLSTVKGRVEKIDEGQSFSVIVDYAHTTDSLEKLYESFENHRKICVLGNCGGGRDKWKRPEMAKVAEKYCNEIILTNEDPYDEDPVQIINDMKKGMEEKTPEVIMDRRLAIHYALERANGHNDIVLITGKGTDPYIMEKGGKKTPWSDEKVTREELRKILNKPEKDDPGSDGNV